LAGPSGCALDEQASATGMSEADRRNGEVDLVSDTDHVQERLPVKPIYTRGIGRKWEAMLTTIGTEPTCHRLPINKHVWQDQILADMLPKLATCPICDHGPLVKAPETAESFIDPLAVR
jgi:hypothetical protein